MRLYNHSVIANSFIFWTIITKAEHSTKQGHDESEAGDPYPEVLAPVPW